MPNTLSSFLGLGWGEEQGGKRSATGTFFSKGNLGTLLSVLSAAHKPLPGPEVTPRQSWGRGEEMDPERFMSQLLKFPGPCRFLPSNVGSSLLAIREGRGNN